MVEIASLVETFPYLGIFLLLLLGDIGLPFPEDTTLILSGFLVAQDVVKLLPAFLVIYSGLLLTDFSLYLVGKKYGRRVVEHRRFRKIISPERLSHIEAKFKKWGMFVVFVGRHIFGIRAQVFLAAGVTGMSAIKFLIADAASAIITITVMVGIGYFGGNSVQALKKDATRIEHIVIIVVILLLAAGILFRHFHNLRNTRK
ncbi:MAG: hypothetical protein A2170_00490 [Deltaproteobacteria bacterium RBG_13_53_10]|nr:MAG: hypothetical protein A2170_00490 [Deltaproteobacteria bacterium RBG_13_53_10]